MSHDLIRRLTDGLDLSEDQARGLFARLTPIVLLEDLDPYPAREPKWRHCIGGWWQGAVAGQYTCIHLRCPPGEMLVVIDRIQLATSATDDAHLYVKAGAGYTTLVSTRMYKDQRVSGTPFAELRYMQNAAHQGDASRTWARNAPSGPWQALEGPFVMDGGATGQAIGIETGAQNIGLSVIFEWRERLRVGSER